MMPEALFFLLRFVGLTFSFIIGLSCGILLTVLLLVTAFFCLTKRVGADADIDCDASPPRTKEEQDLTLKLDSHVQHPNIMQGGKFESYVWIVSGLDWDAEKAIHKFPPPDYGSGDTKGLMKYYAEVKDGVLSFSWIDQTQKKHVMKMELDGCQCRVVHECIGTKSQWWRKAPLEISHPSRCLYQGAKHLFMFCMHGADKEQWYVTLSRNMETGDSIKVLQHLYKRFSKRYRRKTALRFPGRRLARLEQRFIEKGNLSERNLWFGGWRRGQVSRTQSSASQSSESKPMELAEEIEQLWNGGKSHSVFTEEVSRRQYRQQNRKNKLNRRISMKTSTSTSRTEKSSPTPNAVAATPVSSSSESTNLMEKKAAVDSSESSAKSFETGTVDGEGNVSNGSSELPKQTETDDTDIPDCVGNNNNNVNADGVYGLNMFLARWMFDLVRNPDFHEKFRQTILKRLRGLRRPDYVTPLALQTLDLGSNFPEIRSIRSLPPQGTDICPELLVDISYAGGLEVTVETFVDLREASAWGTLDRALSSLQGNQVNSKSRDDSEEIIDDEEVDVLDDGSEVGVVARGDSDSKESLNISNNSTTNEKLQSGFSMRKFAALKAKQWAERMAESISKIPLRLSIRVEKLEGTLMAWIPPPPAKRLWISFLETPTVEITAKPLLANRVMKYSAALGRVSSWLQRKIKQSFFSNLVFPNCADLSFPGLLGLDDPSGLRHPGLAVMRDLTQVSECESDSETHSGTPVTAAVSQRSLNSEMTLSGANYPSLSPIPAEGEEEGEESISPVISLPSDARLDVIRNHRFDTQHLNSLRKSWNGSPLAADQIPSRESHGCTVYKRCVSYSDGDVSEQTSEENDARDDRDGVMSDCIEFFDPDDFSTQPSEEDSTPTPAPVRRTDDSGSAVSQIKSQSGGEAEGDDEKDCDAESPVDVSRSTASSRTLGSRFGNLVRSMQSAAEEMEAARRRRNASVVANNGLKGAARQGVEGTRHKVRGMLENRTAQLRNSGLSKIWTQRRTAEHRERSE